MIRLVISGGQTGVDQAGLDAALAAGISIGGYTQARFYLERFLNLLKVA